jgi:hypothetical protein
MTKQQFQRLPWCDQRMYMEALQDDIYERNEAKWRENGKKGPKPQPPDGYNNRLYNTPEHVDLQKDDRGKPIAPDIGDMLG